MANRVLLLTTHPVAPPWDSADKHIALGVMRGVAAARFTYFGRGLGALPDLRDARALPMWSTNGKPATCELAQALIVGTALQPRYDLIHAVVTVGPSFRWLARAWRLIPPPLRPPLVHTVPGIVDARAFALRDKRTAVVALSESSADDLRTAGAESVSIIEPGIEVEHWPLLEPSGSDALGVLFVGHLEPDGGIRTAIAGVGRARRNGLAVRLTLALRHRPGGNVAAEQRDVLEQARAAGLGDIELHGENAPIPELLRRCSVLVLPAERLHGKADIPVIVLEALASGRPVILSDLPQFTALGDAVLRVQKGDPSALARALSTISSGSSCRRGRRLVESRFSTQAMAAAYQTLYERLISEQSRPR